MCLWCFLLCQDGIQPCSGIWSLRGQGITLTDVLFVKDICLGRPRPFWIEMNWGLNLSMGPNLTLKHMKHPSNIKCHILFCIAFQFIRAAAIDGLIAFKNQFTYMQQNLNKRKCNVTSSFIGLIFHISPAKYSMTWKAENTTQYVSHWTSSFFTLDSRAAMEQ